VARFDIEFSAIANRHCDVFGVDGESCRRRCFRGVVSSFVKTRFPLSAWLTRSKSDHIFSLPLLSSFFILHPSRTLE